MTDFGRDDRTRVLVCENGVCREEEPRDLNKEVDVELSVVPEGPGKEGKEGGV